MATMSDKDPMAYERALEALRELDLAETMQLIQALVDIMFDLGYYPVYYDGDIFFVELDEHMPLPRFR